MSFQFFRTDLSVNFCARNLYIRFSENSTRFIYINMIFFYEHRKITHSSAHGNLFWPKDCDFSHFADELVPRNAIRQKCMAINSLVSSFLNQPRARLSTASTQSSTEKVLNNFHTECSDFGFKMKRNHIG